MRKVKMYGFPLLVVLALSIFSGGCAHNVIVAPKAQEIQIQADQIPMDVGLYLTDGFKNYKVSEFRTGDKWNYTNLGEASASQFTTGLGKIFRTVKVVNEKPPFAKPEIITLQAIIEPAIEQFDFDIPFTKFQVYPAKIRYNIKVYDMDGRLIFTKSIEGIGDTPGSPGFDFTENPSRAASKAIEDGVNKALKATLMSEEIRTLIRK